MVGGGGGGGWVYRANADTALVQMEQSLQELVNYDLLLRRNFLILYQISEYFSYRVRGSENIVELLPVEIKVTFLM